MSKSNINEVEFTNSIGQTIKPGDDVVIVTTRTGNTYTYRGTYLGRHKNSGVSCIKQVRTSYYVYKDTDKRVPYSFWNDLYNEEREWRDQNKPAVLPTGHRWWNYSVEPGYEALHEKYMSRVELKTGDRPRRTTLQLNRIFKIAA